jgi:hypothetical protein
LIGVGSVVIGSVGSSGRKGCPLPSSAGGSKEGWLGSVGKEGVSGAL